MNINVKFAKIYPKARIPTRRNDNIGFDVYIYFDEDYRVLEPHETFVFNAGVVSSQAPTYGFILKECSLLAQYGVSLNCTAINDFDNRSGWRITLTNTSKNKFVISKLSDAETYEALYPGQVTECATGEICVNTSDMTMIYPYSNPVAQALVVPTQNVEVEELSIEDISATNNI